MYLIEVMLDGNPIPLALCRPQSIDAVKEIVGALLASEDTRPLVIRRDPNYVAPPPVLTGLWPDPDEPPSAG